MLSGALVGHGILHVEGLPSGQGFLRVEALHQGFLILPTGSTIFRVPSRALVVPSLRLEHYSPGPVGTLSTVDPQCL